MQQWIRSSARVIVIITHHRKGWQNEAQGAGCEAYQVWRWHRSLHQEGPVGWLAGGCFQNLPKPKLWGSGYFCMYIYIYPCTELYIYSIYVYIYVYILIVNEYMILYVHVLVDSCGVNSNCTMAILHCTVMQYITWQDLPKLMTAMECLGM